MSSISLQKYVNKIQNPTLESLGHALAGATAGACTLIILYPIQQKLVRKVTGAGSSLPITPKLLFDAITQGHFDRISDIYRGLTLGVIERFFFQGIYFFFYSFFKNDWKRKYATEQQPNMPWSTALIRGSTAALLTQLFTTPLKVIQIKKQTATNYHESRFINVVQRIIDEDGPTGFWSGMKASVILVINPAIVSYIYEYVRRYLQHIIGHKSSLIDFLAGAISKAIATVICYPLVSVKMIIQAQGSQQNGGNGQHDEPGSDPPSASASMIDIIREKTARGELYEGIETKLVHSTLTNAIMYTIKEKFTVYTFALMLYIVNIRQRRIKQKMTKMTNVDV